MANLLSMLPNVSATAFMGLLLVPAASAADLPTLPPDLYRGATYDWSGFYAGGYAQAACLDTQYTVSTAASEGDLGGCSFAGGLVGGYGFQFDNVVVGLEGDYGWGSRVAENTADDFVYDFDQLASLRGRLGYAVGDTLLYATGGIAWIKGTLTETALADSEAQWHRGWIVGGGVEHALWPSLNVRVEYLFSSYNEQSYDINCGCTIDADLDSVHMMRAGLTWQFGYESGETFVSY
jgi:opacity protein-like surface antigen